MKKIKIIIMLLFLAVNVTPLKSNAQAAVSFQVFYDNLSPYGNWINYPTYGYVWEPNVGADFRPYVTGGHWVYSDAGWVWVSDYDWGWAPFHYGSWVDDPSYGWLWVPGYDWAPAWVTWGSYNGYYGWAPIAPGFAIGVGYYPPIDRWCFVDPRYMASGNWDNHYYVARGGRIAIGGGIVINNIQRVSVVRNTGNYGGHGYNAGPPRGEFEKVAHTTVTPVSIRESGSPGREKVGGNAVAIYRPKVNAGTKVYSKPAKAMPASSARQVQNAPANRPATANNQHAVQPQPAHNQPQARSNPAPQQQHAAPQPRPQPAPQHQQAPPQHQQAPPQHQQMARPAPQPQHQEAPREEGRPR